MHIMGWLKRSLNRLALRVARATGETPWKTTIDGVNGYTMMARSTPVRFLDLDKLQALLGQAQLHLATQNNALDNDLRTGRTTLSEALDLLAAAPARDRSSLMLVQQLGDEEPLTVHLRTTLDPTYPSRGFVTIMRAPGGSLRELESAAFEIDRHTVDMSRRQLRRRQPIYSPLRAAGAAQQEHEARLSRRAAILGGAVGGVLGLVGAIVGVLVGG